MSEASHTCPSLLPALQAALTQRCKHTQTLSQAWMCQPVEAQKQPRSEVGHLRGKKFVKGVCSLLLRNIRAQQQQFIWEKGINFSMTAAPYTQLCYTPRPRAMHTEKEDKTQGNFKEESKRGHLLCITRDCWA